MLIVKAQKMAVAIGEVWYMKLHLKKKRGSFILRFQIHFVFFLTSGHEPTDSIGLQYF